MYGTDPRSVVLHLSPDEPCLPGDRAELIRQLEAERVPNGRAFSWHPGAPQTAADPPPAADDSLAAVVERRRALLAALDESTPADWDRRTARVVA
ncbi:hypothetical protein ABZS29_38585 [Kribbella sp. NPDC005582]|uniref:hypothetical protein n=1 Tax=Kribbella sp. NPDC005582 TaxID=3156893 RepID=UPI0033BAD890